MDFDFVVLLWKWIWRLWRRLWRWLRQRLFLVVDLDPALLLRWLWRRLWLWQPA
jgi:hypothetical protein